MMLTNLKTTWKFQSGYTLIEVLVAITIIALLFALGYINFRDFSRRQTIAGAGKLLQADLRLAQQQALSGQKPDDIKCNDPNYLIGYFFAVTSTTEYQIYASCSGGTGIAPTKDVVLPIGISISTPSVNPILFKVLGEGTNIPSGTSTTITLTQANTTNTFAVSVGSGGNIQ